MRDMRGSALSSTSLIVALLIAAALMLITPIVTLTERNDNAVQENVKVIVDEFVADIQNTGKLTMTKYQTLVERLNATGNVYDIELEVQHLDENPGKKTTQANYTKIGENVYYTQYTTQVLESLEQGSMLLEPGDNILVSVKNQNSTAAQSLNASFLGITNSDTYAISAEGAGMIYVKGTE